MNDLPDDERPAVIAVLVVDDHAVVRRGITAYFELLDDIEVAIDGRRSRRIGSG